jgi:hypothetical protein
VTESGAQAVRLSGTYDGVLMFAAPDVYASTAALANVFPHLRDGARVVIFGAKFSDVGVGRLLNPLLRMLVATLSPATPIPDKAPWKILAEHVDDVEVEEYFFGAMFLASGSVVTKK